MSQSACYRDIGKRNRFCHKCDFPCRSTSEHTLDYEHRQHCAVKLSQRLTGSALSYHEGGCEDDGANDSSNHVYDGEQTGELMGGGKKEEFEAHSDCVSFIYEIPEDAVTSPHRITVVLQLADRMNLFLI